MISCKECIERLKPDDPRIKSGKYLLCGCDYCNKPSYYRELEEARGARKEIVKVTNMKMTDTQVSFLRKNLIQYIDKKLKEQTTKKATHYTIT